MRHMDNTLFYIPPVMVIMHVATTPRPANANPFRIHTYETVTQVYQTTRL